MSESEIKVVGLSSKGGDKKDSKVIGAIIGVIVLVLGVIAGIFLVKQQQDIREKADELMCTNPSAEQCPGADGILRNCHPPESGGGPTESVCNVANRVEFCGSKCFGCPEPGGEWQEVDRSLCGPTATPIATATATATAIATATATATTGTRTATPTVTATAVSTGTMYFFNTQTKQCETTTAHTNLTTCATNLSEVWPTKFGGTCYSTLTSCQNANLSATATATATSKTKTATPTATATSTSSGSKTATPTATATATSVATSAPIPETGASWPTIVGGGFGIIMVLVSLALAL